MDFEIDDFVRYYTTRLLIGSPPQKFALIVDTGSTVTYVPCSTCEQCGKHQVNFAAVFFKLIQLLWFAILKRLIMV